MEIETGNGSWWATRQTGPASGLVERCGGVEPLEGRTLLSYLVVVKNHKVIPIHVANARLSEPFYSNGLAVKKQPHFYPYYTGPKTPNLLGVSATGFVWGNRVTDGNLTLIGTVAGTINPKPTKLSQQAIYTFAIDRGGASKAGPFPGRPNIRFDAVVVVPLTLGGITAKNHPYVQLNNAAINNPLATTTINLPTSSVAFPKVNNMPGNTITVTVPLSITASNGLTPGTSAGHALNQWNVNFFARFPSPQGSGRNGFHSIASFTPENTMFQVYIQHLTPLRAT